MVYHCNVNGLGPRLEEVQAASASALAVSLQDTRVRPDQADVWRRGWPAHRAYTFDHGVDGPGCALLVKASVRHRLVARRTEERQRLLAVELHLEDGVRLTVASLYAPTAASRGHGVLRRDLLAEALSSRHAVLVGDLNARAVELGCRTSNVNGEVLADFLDGGVALALNDPGVPTFAHSSYDFLDCLDWALATPAAAASLSAVVGGDVGSDHLPLVVRRSGQRPASRRPPQEERRRWRTTGRDWTQPFEADLERRLREEGLTASTTLSTAVEVEACARAIEETIAASADAVLARSRHRADTNTLPLPWWVKVLIKERKRLRRLRNRHPDDVEIRRRLGELRQDIRRAVSEARKERVEQKAAILAHGPRSPEFWPTVRRWFRGPVAELPPLQRPHGEPAVGPDERAEELARHLALALGPQRHRDFDDAFRAEVEAAANAGPPLLRLTADGDDDDEEEEADPEEPTAAVSPSSVAREISRLRGGRAPGPDGISTDLIKAAPFALAVALATVFTGSLRVGYVPSRWRLAWVRMLPKPGKLLTSAADFRPVALTSCLGKILERLFARRLQCWCDRRGLLPVEQSGFRCGRDAEEQVVLLTQRAVQAMNGGLVTAVAALDISKAYDSVWHAGLLHQCREALSPASTRWIAAFLHDRSAAVLEAGHLSAPFPTPSGVPQGSPLSPLLYIFYTRSMPLPRGEGLGATAYADDVAVWATARTPAAAWSRLEPHLDTMVAWGRRWRLRFSEEKTQAAYLTRRLGGWTGEALERPSFLGARLEWSPQVDLLGVRIDRGLNFLRHAQRVQRRLAPRTLDLRRMLESSPSVPRWVGLLLYKVLLRPCLTYAAPVLTMTCDSGVRVLERAERRGLRAAIRARTDTPSEELYRRAATAGRVREEIRRLAGGFLVRHARHHNGRLLTAFSTEVEQGPHSVYVDGPLERALASARPEDRPAVVAWVRAHVMPPPPRRPGRPSRARASTSSRTWGLSPFDARGPGRVEPSSADPGPSTPARASQ